MSEAVSIAAPSATLGSASQLSSSRETRRYLLAEFFSAIVSGGGQLFLGQQRRGSILLLPLSALIFGLWPVRLLRFYPGLITLFAAWISLYTIPSGKSFVMTDSRDIGLDSRSSEFGLVEHGSIVGKPWYVFGSDRVGGNIR